MQPDGLRTVHRYDAAGNEILRTDSAGRETAYEYDGHHNRTAERMADGLQVRENRSVYDWMGRLTETADAEGNRTQYRYGEAGGKLEDENTKGVGKDNLTVKQMDRSKCRNTKLGNLSIFF